MGRIGFTREEERWHKGGKWYAVPAGTKLEVLPDSVLNDVPDQIARDSVVEALRVQRKAGESPVMFHFMDGVLRHMDASLIRFGS